MSTSLQKGFTTIELMVVVIVIAVLATLAAPSLIDTVNKNKVVSTTNQLIGLIEFARNTAKSTNKPIAIFKCSETEECGLKVDLLGKSDTSSTPSLRVMNKKDMNDMTYTGGNATGNDSKLIAFYPDGTRGLHVNANVIKGFNDDGSFKSNSSTTTDGAFTNDFSWQVIAGNYCRKITVMKVGNVKVETEGCL